MKLKPVFYRSEAQRENEMCKLKVTYNSKESAQRAHAEQRPYECPYCKRWHLTTKC